MSRPRLENLDPERQRTLFEAAADEFAANGFDSASLNRILEKSGMSKSSLYYYFDDKADLFTTLVERSIAILFKQIGDFDPARLTAETYWSEFEARYSRAVSIVNGNGWLVRFGGMFYALRSDPKHSAPTGRIFDAARRWVAAMVARGQELGVVRSDLPNTLLIDSVMGLFESLDRWVVTHWSQMTEAERAAMPAKHIGMFRDLVGVRASADHAPAGGPGHVEAARRP
jgi:AcrR family transcriptional regulator